MKKKILFALIIIGFVLGIGIGSACFGFSQADTPIEQAKLFYQSGGHVVYNPFLHTYSTIVGSH